MRELGFIVGLVLIGLFGFFATTNADDGNHRPTNETMREAMRRDPDPKSIVNLTGEVAQIGIDFEVARTPSMSWLLITDVAVPDGGGHLAYQSATGAEEKILRLDVSDRWRGRTPLAVPPNSALLLRLDGVGRAFNIGGYLVDAD